MMVWFILAVLLAFVLTAVEFFGIYRLKAHRLDISPDASPWSGGSRFVQINALRPGNYSDLGREKLRSLYAVVVARWVVTFLAMWLGYWALFGQ